MSCGVVCTVVRGSSAAFPLPLLMHLPLAEFIHHTIKNSDQNISISISYWTKKNGQSWIQTFSSNGFLWINSTIAVSEHSWTFFKQHWKCLAYTVSFVAKVERWLHEQCKLSKFKTDIQLFLVNNGKSLFLIGSVHCLSQPLDHFSIKIIYSILL